MEVFELILMLAAAVLASSVLEQVIPKVSPPLIQIALGVVIAILAVNPIDVTLNPEFFLVVFIAPLLFHDARESDKPGLWHNRRFILSLAIGLVVAIVLAVGFCVHALIPSIPLAVAFALGGALGPTDAVAVASLGASAKLDRKESALLSGESLINDASGVVSFQFAIAAAVTGSFSLVDASVSFTIDFFGGILLGLLLGWLAHGIQTKLDESGLDSNTFHVLFDVTLPFIIYLSAELVSVNGILAVVSAGLLLGAYTKRIIGPRASTRSIVSSSFWGVITFTINGIVFVLLGMQLPKALRSTWDNVEFNNFALIGYVLLITAILVIVRFVWIIIIDRISKDPDTGCHRCGGDRSVHSALISTFGGPKGAVTLSVIFSTPLFMADGSDFPQRDLIIFLASGVILCTLLLANFILPILAPRTDQEEIDETSFAHAKVDIMRAVIDRLAASRTRETNRATGIIISSYNARIERIQNQADIESESSVQLRSNVITHQMNHILQLIENQKIDDVDGYRCLRRLSLSLQYLQHRTNRWFVVNFQQHARTALRVTRRSFDRTIERLGGHQRQSSMLEVQIEADREAIRYLHRFLDDDRTAYPTEIVTDVLFSYQKTLKTLERPRNGMESYARAEDGMEDVERLAYNIELEEIQAAYDRGAIDRTNAKNMRDNVYLMLVDLETPI